MVSIIILPSRFITTFLHLALCFKRLAFVGHINKFSCPLAFSQLRAKRESKRKISGLRKLRCGVFIPLGASLSLFLLLYKKEPLSFITLKEQEEGTREIKLSWREIHRYIDR